MENTLRPDSDAGGMGALIRLHRLRRRMTQSALAERSGLRRDYISSLEVGRIEVAYPEPANRLREALGFPGWRLLEEMGYKTDVFDFKDANPELMTRVGLLRPEQQQALVGLLTAFET